MDLKFHISNVSVAASLLSEMSDLYRGLDRQIVQMEQTCQACGRCCDFEAFGHRLYLTTPELLYFAHYVGRPLTSMAGGVCPYRIDGKCSVYPFRFAGCRIFQCEGDATLQSDLTETTLGHLKRFCTQYAIPYYYLDLKTALQSGQ